jgi:hypothetical protein
MKRLDCASRRNGVCIALKPADSADCAGCSFFKTREQATQDRIKSYNRRMALGMFPTDADIKFLKKVKNNGI